MASFIMPEFTNFCGVGGAAFVIVGKIVTLSAFFAMSTLFNLTSVRRLCWTVLLGVLLCQSGQGQNLVANPSFEDVNTCAEFSQPCSPSAWFYLSRKLTTGYFPRFPSATGQRHLQIVAVNRETGNRQYWETMLLCPLEAGERYVVSVKVASPAGEKELSSKPPNLRDIGIWFTNKFVFVEGDSLLQPRSFLSFYGATPKDLKNGWFEVKKEFSPAGRAGILIVGNFNRMTNADILEQREWSDATIEVLVDDIAVVPVKGGLCAGAQTVKDSLYSVVWRHSEIWPPNDVVIAPHDTVRKLDSPRVGAPVVPAVPVVQKTDTIIIPSIQFDFDQYLMQHPDSLQRYRAVLTQAGIRKVQVVGFTDDIGSEAYNLDLSQKRAVEVGRLLTEKFGLPAALITTEGRGISTVYATKEMNRRVEIYIYH
jgi:outer membrane protein OmpA-like peptidoglycan-associated protein